ncbi:hypothetical protein FQR65_LT15134 [Abscondita terminalis]|nr:hypothetical protein FQR65_LT15134 [Abscondita terminalis]
MTTRDVYTLRLVRARRQKIWNPQPGARSGVNREFASALPFGIVLSGVDTIRCSVNMEQSAEDIFLENLENDLKTTFPTFLRNILKFKGLAKHVSFKQLNDADLDKLEEFVRTEVTELVEKDEYESYFGPFHKKLLISIEINDHSLIKLIQKYRDNKQFSQMKHFTSWLFSSQPCEQVFRSTRSMTSTFSTKVNFSLQDIMNRLHKIEVLVNTVNDLSDKFIFPRESGEKMGVAVGGELQSQNLFPKDCEIELVCMKALIDAKDNLAKLGITSNDRSWIDIGVSKYTINSQNNHNIDDNDINDGDDDKSYLDHIISEETTTNDTFLARVDEITEDLEKSTPEDQENVPEDLLNMELTGFGEQLNMKDHELESIRPHRLLRVRSKPFSTSQSKSSQSCKQGRKDTQFHVSLAAEPPHPFKMPVNILPECYNAMYYSDGWFIGL